MFYVKSLENFISFIKTYKWKLLWAILLITSLIINCVAIKSCNNSKNLNNNNIIALTDTIKYYKTKSGELAVSKTLLEGDLSTLKLANDSLYKVVKDMKVSDPSTVVYIKSYVDNPEKDTVWNIIRDTIHGEITKDFAFNDKYRSLEGYITSSDTTLGLNIKKDQVYFDYTLAIEDSKIYLKSNNPYVKFDNITGITIPKPKKYKYSIGIGPQIGYGYDFVAKKGVPYVGIGISLNYNILSFGLKK